MDNFKQKTLLSDTAKNNSEYLYSVLSLIIIFLLLSAVEIFKNFSIQMLAYKLMNDISTGLIIGLLFFPIYSLFKYFKASLGLKVIKIIFFIITLIQVGLTGYSLTARVNLGADLISYNLNDILHTLETSVHITFKTVLPFLALILFYWGINWLVAKFCPKLNIRYVLIALFVLAGLNLVITDSHKPLYQNKIHFLISDIIKTKRDRARASEGTNFKKEFPLEKPSAEIKDVLSPFFNIKKDKPNVVFIIVEGLGSDFVDKGEYEGFTPYLDQLASKSLYWQNFLSNAGRTFGALPSIMGSLPFGDNGFLEIKPYPKHNSLISILKSNGYSSTYYCGADSNFDRKSSFLEFNGIDKIIDVNNFGNGYQITQKDGAGFSWGYPDSEIFRRTLADLDSRKSPRLDIIMTLTNHEPWDFPQKDIYMKKVESILNTKSYLEKNKYSEFKDIFSCLLYTDNSIKEFIEGYSKRPDYNNTIFIITGDHRLVPVPMKDNLCRFHVPLYIFSPMLKKTAVFKSISSQLDVAPSLVSFLLNNYQFNKLKKTNWLGKGLDTVREFRSTQKIPFMRVKGVIADYIYKDYFYSDDILYKIDENFNLSETSDGSLETVSSSFNDFKKLNSYVISKNKITNYSFSFVKPIYKFTPEEFSMIKKMTKGLNSDDIFFLARKLAFNKEREKSRLLCNYILNDIPNYSDVRILKGRTFAWDGKYKEAEKELVEAIQRNPSYSDGYNALMDVYFWSDQDKKAVNIGKQALSNKINNPEISFKLAKSYQRVENKVEAQKQIDSLLNIYPENQEYIKFKKSLK